MRINLDEKKFVHGLEKNIGKKISSSRDLLLIVDHDRVWFLLQFYESLNHYFLSKCTWTCMHALSHDVGNKKSYFTS